MEVRSKRSERNDATKIKFEIEIIEDRANNLAEFEGLRGGAPLAQLESRSILPALRIMAKNDVIKMLSAPRMTCSAGQTATVEIAVSENEKSDGEPSVGSLKLEVSAKAHGRGLVVDIGMGAPRDGGNAESRWSILISAGETILVRASANPRGADVADAATPLYVALTPTVVGERVPRSVESAGFQYLEPPTAE